MNKLFFQTQNSLEFIVIKVFLRYVTNIEVSKLISKKFINESILFAKWF